MLLSCWVATPAFFLRSSFPLTQVKLQHTASIAKEGTAQSKHDPTPLATTIVQAVFMSSANPTQVRP